MTLISLREAKEKYGRIMTRPLTFQEKTEKFHETTKESLSGDDYMDVVGIRFREHGVLGQKWGVTHEKDVVGKKDISSWKKIGEKQGSNEGGTFETPDGTKHYVKFYTNPEQGKSEVLANKIYNELFIPAPYSELVTLDGKEGVASMIIPGVATNRDEQKGAPAIQKGFVADAFLANHDVVGLTHDNIIKTPEGKAIRIDNGGSMFFRARGKPKDFDKFSVPELSTMRNVTIAKQAGYVFSDITKGRIMDQSKHLVATLTNEKIRNLVHEAGFKGADAEKYSSALIGRRDALSALAKEPDKIPPKAVVEPPPYPGPSKDTTDKTTLPPPTYLKPEGGDYQDQAHQFVADYVKKNGLPSVLLPKEYSSTAISGQWDPENNKRQGLFNAAGIDGGSYKKFHGDIQSWIHGNYKSSIQQAAKEIIDKKPNLSMLAQCLLVENGINKSFYSSSNLKRTTTQLYRGLKSDVAQKAVAAKKAGADGFVYTPRSVESFTTNLKKATKDFAGEGGIVVHDAVPIKNILVSYRTNGIFRASTFETEKEHIVLMPQTKTIPFAKQGGIRLISKIPKKYQSGYIKPPKKGPKLGPEINPEMKKAKDEVTF